MKRQTDWSTMHLHHLYEPGPARFALLDQLRHLPHDQTSIQRGLEALATPIVAWCTAQEQPPVGVEIALQQLISRLVVLAAALDETV